MSFTKLHERRVRRLAVFLEKSRSRFSMGQFENECGTPACVAGHGFVLFKKELQEVDGTGDPWKLAGILAGAETSSTRQRIYAKLFHSTTGCGGIGLTMPAGKKAARAAARYLRKVFIPWAQENLA